MADKSKSWANAVATADMMARGLQRKHYVRGYRIHGVWRYGVYRVPNPPVPGRSWVTGRN